MDIGTPERAQDLERGWDRDHLYEIPTLSPGDIENPARITQGEWVLRHFTARQLMSLASERLTMYEVER